MGTSLYRYALFGTDHVAQDQECIRGVQFVLEGVETSIFMRGRTGAFGLIHDPDDEIVDAILRKRPDYLHGDFVKGQAMVSYFTGNYELLPRTETVLGTISASRIVQTGSLGPENDTMYIAIDFDDTPTTVEGTWDKMREVRQFFAWMMGYAPAWKDVVVFTSSSNDDGQRVDVDGHLDRGFEAFGPSEWREVSDNNRHNGSLIDASEHAQHFMAVMGKWLERNHDRRRRSANIRYFGSLQGMNRRVVEDGIVSAANTFDLLPSSDKPPPVPLSPSLAAILEDARERVRKEAKACAQRAEVLSGLGRIKAGANLRSIVQHRAEVVVARFGADQLPGLDEVIRQAVLCRNYYTHGSDETNAEKLDFTDTNVVLFLTRSLEFIYATSELLLCGWKEAKSLGYDRHPLGSYLKQYGYYRSTLRLE